MLVCMLIWGELAVGEMIWNLLLTLLFSSSVVVYLGKVIRLAAFEVPIKFVPSLQFEVPIKFVPCLPFKFLT